MNFNINILLICKANTIFNINKNSNEIFFYNFFPFIGYLVQNVINAATHLVKMTL